MRQVRNFYFLIAFLISLLIVIKSIDYIVPQFDSGYLSDKSGIFHFYKYFLYAHIIGAPIAFIAGLIQFSVKFSKWHKILGFIYVTSVLILAAPGGLVMSFYAIGGIPSIINFIILSSLWFYFTLRAYIDISKGNSRSHKLFMTRSFILANSAILIRVLSFINNYSHLTDITTGYIFIGWLSWLPALLTFEFWLLNKANDKS
ncbi:MAG: DUF2306 domain-containing protein [Fulvivirga sp.]|uniref:DUF2306 domain-containing protein n=1 Tax=Fulvivirga sp. TaxID=1931237 RepID=UPI0032EE28CC